MAVPLGVGRRDSLQAVVTLDERRRRADPDNLGRRVDYFTLQKIADERTSEDNEEHEEDEDDIFGLPRLSLLQT
jgi:hypothetical protein